MDHYQCTERADRARIVYLETVRTQHNSQDQMDTPYLQALELCVEIRSPSNSIGEMLAKKDLHLARGAQEFWLVDEEGRLSFYSYSGEQELSTLFADFPSALVVPE